MKKKKTKKQNKDFSSSSSSSSSSLKPVGRRNRTKRRKPKFLSLRLQLSQSQPKKSTMIHQKQQQQPQLNLFPLHPENTVVEDDDDKAEDMMHEDNNDVAFLFSSDGGATLNGLLEEDSTMTAATTTTSEEGSFTALGGGESGSWLVRKAMRRSNKEREGEGSEERWVCYSEVVEEKKETTTEEVTSATVSEGRGVTTTFGGSLSLKLDHEGILNAWSHKGSLYVEGEAPQIVPDLVHGVPLHNAFVSNVPWDGWGNDVGNIWTVPEGCGANKMKVKEEMGWKLGQREASVLRYKEKRQSRLFSKRIRYEVRKLNAEKRPRMKGRFVKRE